MGEAIVTPDEIKAAEEVALQPAAHILDRIEAWCDLAEHYHNDKRLAYKAPLCVQQIKHMVQDEQAAGW